MAQNANALPVEVDSRVTMLALATWGANVRIMSAERLPGNKRSLTYRLALDGDAAPASVVVKVAQPTDGQFNPAIAAMPAWTFFNEWASLQFLAQVAMESILTPRWLAGDRATGTLIMSDLGQGTRLDHVLLGADPAAATAKLVEYAATHGRLHALTRPHIAEYQQMRAALGPLDNTAREYTGFEWLLPTWEALPTTLDLAPEPGTTDEIQHLVKQWQHPDPFQTFIQGDPCPDNCLWVDGQMHLLDFEGGRIQHAFTDGVYGTMRFPTCWCVDEMPEAVADAMAFAYRQAVQVGIPEAADDQIYHNAVAEACVFWILDWCRAFPLTEMLAKDERWRMATVRQRFLRRLAIVANMTARAGHLEAVGATCARLHTALVARWPAETHAMPFYPAFA